jgi:hypothetical protein
MSRPFNVKPRVLNLFFVVLGLILTVTSYFRLKWSWPDVTWQSQYWIINDIDKFMSRDFSNVIWFEFANREWSLNGWRWLSYFNAQFFSWNMAFELFVYSLTVLGIFLLILHSIFSRMSEVSWTKVFLILMICFTLFSFAGAGARGMELGTFIGIFFTILLFKIALSENRKLVSSYFLPPFIIFVFSGGYAIATTATLLFLLSVVLFKYRKVEIFPNLRIASISCAVSLSVYMFVFLSRGRQGPSSLQSFFLYLQEHPLYPIKFLFYAPQGGLITIQSVESLTAKEFSIITVALGFFLLLLNLFCFIYSLSHLRAKMLLPLSLLLYSIGTSITIMLTRLTGDFGMLSPWYALHLKVGVVGCLWLLIVFMSNSDLNFPKLNLIVSGTAIALIPILIFANSSQWKRQPYERAYFQEIKKATLFPELLKVDSDGLTPLKIGLQESRDAIEILKRHKIGVYRDDIEAKSEFINLEGYLPLGDNFTDGWVGPNPQYLFQKGFCRLIQFKISNAPKLLRNEVSLTIDGNLVEVFLVKRSPYVLNLPKANSIGSVAFNFSNSLIPADNDLGPDLRRLSAFVKVKCQK